MKRNTSVTLTEHFQGFVAEQVRSGRYDNASEVVRAGLRLLEEREHRLAALREALVAGETSGDAGPLDFEAIRQAGRERVGLEE